MKVVGGRTITNTNNVQKSTFDYYLKFLILLSLLSYVYMGASVWVVVVHDNAVSTETKGGCCSH